MSSPMPHRHLTDDDIAALPLSSGRAELLEEIMSAPVRTPLAPKGPPGPDRARRRMRRLVPLAAAAVVAALAVVPVLIDSGDDAPGDTAETTTASEITGPHGVLVAPGWTVDDISGSPGGYDSLSYNRGEERLDITAYPAGDYQSYVEDRAEVKAVGEMDVLGRTSTVRAYSATDHAVMRSPQNGGFVEIRGSGMGIDAFRMLVGRVALVNDEDFARALPDSVVTPDEVDDVMRGMLADIPIPPGFTLDDVRVEGFNDRYQVGAPLTQAVSCGWVAVYSSGDPALVTEATEAMRSSRQWDILREMAPQGDWSPAIWDVGRKMGTGMTPERLRQTTGC